MHSDKYTNTSTYERLTARLKELNYQELVDVYKKNQAEGRLPFNLNYFFYNRLDKLSYGKYGLNKDNALHHSIYGRKPFVPRGWARQNETKETFFGAADFETVLGKDGNHQVVMAAAIFDHEKNYEQGNVLNKDHPLLKYLNKNKKDSLKKLLEESTKLIFTQLDQKEILSDNFEKNSSKLILDFIKNLEKTAQELNKSTDSPGNKDKKTLIYFHNLGLFDGIFILHALFQNQSEYTRKIFLSDNEAYEIFAEPRSLMNNGRIYEIELKSIILRDSFLLMPDSLESIGQSFFNQGKLEFSPENVTRENFNIYENDFKEYLIYDAALLLGSLIFFRRLAPEMAKGGREKTLENITKDVDITDALSLSSLSYRYFRQYYLKKSKIHISTRNERIHNYLKEAFKGGVAEVYSPHAKNGVFIYDINSSYPFCMAYKPMPLGAPKWVRSYFYDELEKGESYLDRFFGFLEVTVNVPEDLYFPPLPIPVRKKQEVLVNPTGKFKGTFFSEELKWALKQGVTIIKVHSALQYEEGEPFKKYIERLFKLRQRAKKSKKNAQAFITKSLMNSLFGRLSFHDTSQFTQFLTQESLDALSPLGCVLFQRRIRETNYVLANIGYESFGYYGDVESLEKAKLDVYNRKSVLEADPNNFYVARQISASITAYARMELFKVKYKLAKEGYKIYYSDTDSVHIDKKLPDNHQFLGADLGKLKFEGYYDEAIYLTSKVYALRSSSNNAEIIKCSGLEKEGVKKLSFKDFSDYYHKNNGESFEVTFNRPFYKKMNELGVKNMELTRTLQLNFKKRIKIFENNLWENTRPLNYQKDDLDRNIYIENFFSKIPAEDFKKNKPKDGSSTRFSVPIEVFENYLELLYFGVYEYQLNFARFYITMQYIPSSDLKTDQSSSEWLPPIVFKEIGSNFDISKDLDRTFRPLRKLAYSYDFSNLFKAPKRITFTVKFMDKKSGVEEKENPKENEKKELMNFIHNLRSHLEIPYQSEEFYDL